MPRIDECGAAPAALGSPEGFFVVDLDRRGEPLRNIDDEVADAVAERKDRVDARVGALEPARPACLVEDLDGKMLGEENVRLRQMTIERRRVLGAQDPWIGKTLRDPRRIAFRAGKKDEDGNGILRRRRGG